MSTINGLAAARTRWLVDRDRLLAIEGPPLSTQAVSKLLGVSDDAVERARVEGRLIGVLDGDDNAVYPRWQFGPSGRLAGLDEVAQALGADDPWGVIAFVLEPNGRLGDVTPLNLLRRGGLEAALRAASAHGEHGAA